MSIVKIKHFLRNSRQYLFCRDNNIDISQYKHFIFLDSKVPNIIEQIYPYFYKGFFDKEKVVIVFRHHFENIRTIKKAMDKFSLKSYCFINLRDIPSLKNVTWFYTHNSMTNLAVINKNVYSKHIWMGHGDSEKVASYKKIIRIYDYCLVLGEKSINRFYKNNLFREEESYRFIRVGKAVLCSILPLENDGKERAILFAPTWEGAMVEENYSTLHLPKENAKFIDTISKNVDTIVIKLHPNTGIRDSKVVPLTIQTIQALLDLNKKLIFIAEKGDWVYGYIHKRFGDKLEYRDKLYKLQDYKFEAGVTNISAMATMIDVEGIKTFVLYDRDIEIQDRVTLVSGEKVNLRGLKASYSFEHRLADGLVTYEQESWRNLSQSELFDEVIKFIDKRS
jgi:hypothetical protein